MVTLDPSEGIALVTDGSAYHRDRSGGWAYVALDAFEGMVKGSGYHGDTTISQMELFAPTQGLKQIADTYGACEVLVYSDSAYVVLGATYKERKRSKNKKFWKDLDDEIARHIQVEFIHVRGHSGHMWNEMVDAMAGIARRKGAK